MKALLNGWNFMRILRLLLGMVIMVQGIIVKDIMSIILGLIFGAMAVANVGCCGTNQCAINIPSANKRKSIQDEELDFKK